MQLPTLSLFLARLGVVFCFVAFGIWELQAPDIWSTYVPGYMAAIAPLTLLVQIHGVVLLVIALGVLSGVWPRLWTLLATLVLAELCLVVFEGEGFSDVFVRDVSLLLFSAALTAQAWKRRA
jgi:hypothetical protein